MAAKAAGSHAVNGSISRIVIVGGGTAGWLSACLIAASANRSAGAALEVTLVESPDVATVGVGEGTWPTMRRTLERIGISEADFLLACDAAFKQGSRFDGWMTGAAGEFYDHPFVPPEGDASAGVEAWHRHAAGRSYADMMSAQPRACRLALAPRQRPMPDYAGALNYAYHLDAAKLARLLARHAIDRLGVRHVADHVVAIEHAENGDIAALETRGSGSIEGDFFLDCSGHAALLIGGEFGVPFIDRSDVLFNDRALAVQVPVPSDSPIASQTVATAHGAGWIWDIGLPGRRGVGCVYASRFMTDDEARAVLSGYLGRTAAALDPRSILPRKLSFRSGHRARFWERNCLAIGLSAGFLEPLEASAIVLIELSLDALLDHFPTDRAVMDIHAERFNTLFRYRWDRIVEFLKLHYVLSRRDEPYWQAHRDPASIPQRLADLLRIWRDAPPSPRDFPAIEEVFPAASYRYVLYGMNFPTPEPGPIRPMPIEGTAALLRQVEQRARTLSASLPTNRAYLDALRDAAEAMPIKEHTH